jgi:CDP-glycerol glycerophosphotransferase
VDDAFEIAVRTSGDAPPAAHLAVERRDRRDLRLLPLEPRQGGRLVARLPVTGPPGPMGPRPLPAETWHLGVVSAPGTDHERHVPLQVLRSAVAALPVGLVDPVGRGVEVDDLAWQRPAVVVGDGLDATDRGRFHQQRLWSEVAARRGADPATVVVDDGTRSGDVAAVVAELQRRHPGVRIVTVTDGSHTGRRPDGATVVAGSRAWAETLATAGTVITDRPLPRGFVRADGQRVARLWSAAPVRPLGLTRPAVRDAHPSYRDAIVRGAARWTHLVSPAPAATRVLRDAYAFEGQVLETGAPRFDGLRIGEGAGTLPPPVATGPTALWLSTWSDEDRHPGGTLRATPEVDLRRLREALGSGGRLFARSHPDVGDRAGDDLAEAGVLDVSDHPDLVALLRGADVVVAPPTSVVLDAVTVGTPVIVFDPGGEWPALGPLHVDLTTDVPWPVVTDEADLTATVAETLTTSPAQPPPPAVRDHLDHATGTAAAAVVDVLFDAG